MAPVLREPRKGGIERDEHDRVWPTDFVEFVHRERVFATLLTPTGYGRNDYRWDTYRICEFSEILAFYGLPYWYPFQVTVLGLGPIWMRRGFCRRDCPLSGGRAPVAMVASASLGLACGASVSACAAAARVAWIVSLSARR
jgi:hypothetical protein